jgi:hypothetical protein
VVYEEGASTVKWIAPDPCLVLSESDSKLYSNFELCEEKILDTSRNIGLQSQAIYDDKNNSKKSLHILKDTASGVHVGGIEQATL